MVTITAIALIIFYVGIGIIILSYLLFFIRRISCHSKQECKKIGCPHWEHCAHTARKEAELKEVNDLRKKLQEYNELLLRRNKG